MIRQHHQLNRHEFEKTPGNTGRQRRLEGYSAWGSQRVRHNLVTEQQQIHLKKNKYEQKHAKAHNRLKAKEEKKKKLEGRQTKMATIYKRAHSLNLVNFLSETMEVKRQHQRGLKNSSKTKFCTQHKYSSGTKVNIAISDK